MGARLEVKLTPDKSFRKGRRVRRPEDVAAVCRDLAESDRERVHVLHLDVANRLLAREEAAVGGLALAAVSPREVFKGALVANSAAIVLVHNHPSGDPTPSPADRELTRRLAAIGAWLGIPLLDHVVVARGGFRSLGGPFPNAMPTDPILALPQTSTQPVLHDEKEV